MVEYVLDIQVYGNGAFVRIFEQHYVVERLYWRSNVYTETRKSYELYYKEEHNKNI